MAGSFRSRTTSIVRRRLANSRQLAGDSHLRLESRLADLHGRAEARLVANATTGIYLALRAAGISGRPVGVPNNVCFNVPLAVLLSGNRPVYLDIEEATLGLAPGSVTETREPLAALIAVHAYGCMCAIESIAQRCRELGVLLIEDLACAQGANRNGRTAGGFGDVSVMSFGRGKIIDVGGGGAVLTDDRVLLDEMIALDEQLPVAAAVDQQAADELSNWHTDLYNTTYPSGLNAHAPQFRQRALAAGRGFVHRSSSDWADEVSRAIDRLPDNVAGRAARAEFLFSRFDDAPSVACWRPSDGAVYWRFNLLVRAGRDRMLRHLLAEGYKASSWYPSVDLFFESRHVSPVKTPVSDAIGDSILNIWLNDEVDSAYLTNISTAILAYAC